MPAPSTPRRHAPVWAGLLAALSMAAVMLVVDAGERARLSNLENGRVLERLSLVRVRLESHLNQVIASARALAVVYATHPALTADEFAVLAREIVERNPSIINVGLIRGTVLSQVYPEGGNERAIGLDIRQTPSMWPAFQRMISSRKTVIAGPVALVQGGTGVIVRIPVFRAGAGEGPEGGEFLGAVSIPLNADKVLEQADLQEVGRELVVALRGRDGQGASGDTFYGDAATFARAQAQQVLVLPGGTWVIGAYLRDQRLATSLVLIRTLGALLCLLAAGTAYSLSRGAQMRELDQARVRTANERLGTLLEAVPDLLFELDAEGAFLGVWPGRHADLLLVPPAEMIGRRYSALLPPPAVQVIQAALAEARSRGHSQGQRICLPLPSGDAWFELSVALIGTVGGDEPRFLVLSRDISSRVRDESELRIAATAFQSHESLMITDAAHRIIRVNQAFSETCGYSAQEALGRTPAMLQSGRHDSVFYRQLHEQLAREGRWKGEIWNRRKNGEIYPEWLTITAVKDASGQTTHFIGSATDVTQRKRDEAHIYSLAFHDPLTGLPNRRLLVDRVAHALAAGARTQQHAALLFIDLDNFKTLNDTKGHVFGDELLRHVAERLRQVVRDGDTVARLGGDEFVIMLETLGTDAASAAGLAKTVGEKIRAAVGVPYRIREAEVHASCSIGVRLFDQHAEVDELLKHADTAMYAAKNAGRNAVRFFDPAMEAALSARAELELDLRQALALGQFALHYQPQVDAQGRITGAEALLRWQHPQRGLVPPLEFIGLAEDTGLIHALGDWVLETACAQLHAWAGRPETRHLVLSVNVSARQLHEGGFLARVQHKVLRHHPPSGRLKLELTESSLLDGADAVIALMYQLKALGLGFSLDDFGTGYSSLQYLKRLPLDELKIDRSFTRDIVDDGNDRAIVATIIGMARSLNLAVIAEGVETEDQRSALADAGCTHWQGYLFGRPVPIEAFEAQLPPAAG